MPHHLPPPEEEGHEACREGCVGAGPPDARIEALMDCGRDARCTGPERSLEEALGCLAGACPEAYEACYGARPDGGVAEDGGAPRLDAAPAPLDGALPPSDGAPPPPPDGAPPPPDGGPPPLPDGGLGDATCLEAIACFIPCPPPPEGEAHEECLAACTRSTPAIAEFQALARCLAESRCLGPGRDEAEVRACGQTSCAEAYAACEG